MEHHLLWKKNLRIINEHEQISNLLKAYDWSSPPGTFKL